MENGRLGKYEIRGILGKGAMGTVYDGYDAIIDRRVAIKTMNLPDSTDAEAQDELARFRREAQAAGRLTHPNIVAVFDYGEDGKIAFIVMEYAPGIELKKLLDKGDRLPPAEAVRIMEGVLAGLQYSHERGVVHRDIKPGNIIISPDGTVKIADFGIARIESSSMTQAGTIMGTPAYMSPEQFMGQTVDARTDIYSSGVMFYQLLTGERPFEGGMTAIMHKALNTEAPKPSDLSVTAPAALDPVVAKAMAKRPEDRYESAAAFAQAIRAAMSDSSAANYADPLGGDDATLVSSRPKPAAPPPPSARPAPTASPAPIPAPAGKSRMPLIAAIVVVVLALGGVGGYFAMSGGSKPTTVASLPAPQTTPLVTPPAPVLVPVVKPPPVVPPAADVSTASAPPPPVISPAPAPAPAPAPPPVQTASIATTPAMIRDALAAALHPAACSLTRTALDGRSVVISGLAGSGSEGALRQAVQAALPAGAATDSYNMRLDLFDGPYCDVLDILRPTSAQSVGLSLRNGVTRLKKDQDIVPQVVMPDFPAWLELDYFSSDGSVSHLHPTTVNPATLARAGGTVIFGNTTKERWQVDAPFGTDMIVAIASSSPLFSAPRPVDETVPEYLAALRRALADADARGDRVAANAMLVQTLAK
jgi:serine/threonine-protein kinase